MSLNIFNCFKTFTNLTSFSLSNGFKEIEHVALDSGTGSGVCSFVLAFFVDGAEDDALGILKTFKQHRKLSQIYIPHTFCLFK